MRKIHCLFLVLSHMYYNVSLDSGNNDESSDLFLGSINLEKASPPQEAIIRTLNQFNIQRIIQ